MQSLAELPVDLPPAIAATAAQVALVSDFVSSVLARYPHDLVERLSDRVAAHCCEARRPRSILHGSEAAAMSALRRFRHIEMARIAWRDLAGWDGSSNDLADLSRWRTARSKPRPPMRQPAEPRPPLCATRRASRCRCSCSAWASSAAASSTSRRTSISCLCIPKRTPSRLATTTRSSAQAYYLRLAQLLIKLLDHKTDDGFVFRVDTRLRPFGASGPLVVSMARSKATWCSTDATGSATRTSKRGS